NDVGDDRLVLAGQVLVQVGDQLLAADRLGRVRRRWLGHGVFLNGVGAWGRRHSLLAWLFRCSGRSNEPGRKSVDRRGPGVEETRPIDPRPLALVPSGPTARNAGRAFSI